MTEIIHNLFRRLRKSIQTHTTPARLEQARRELQRCRLLLEVTSDWIWEADADIRFTYCSPKIKDVLGYEPEEMIGRSPLDFVAPEGKSAAFENLRTARSSPDGLTGLVVRCVRKDGGRAVLEINAVPILNQDRSLACIRGVARDITARQSAEDALAESERRYRLLFERNLAGVFRVAPDGRYLDCNETCARTLGFNSREEFLAHSAAELFVNPADLQAVLALLRERKSVTNLELCLKHKDGSLVPVLENVTLVENEAGYPYVIEGTFIDISRRKLAEKLAEEAAIKFKTIFDSVQTGIVIIDPQNHRIVDVNPSALSLIGCRREAVIGAECFQFICPAEKGRCPVTDLGQTVDNSERALLTVDGRRCPIMKTVVSQLISGRQYLLESFVDISAVKRAEESIRTSEARFRALVEYGGDLVLLLDLNGLCLYAGPSTQRILGYTEQEVIGSSIFEFMHPECSERTRKVLLETVRNPGVPAVGECRYRHKRGAWRWYEFTCQARPDEDPPT